MDGEGVMVSQKIKIKHFGAENSMAKKCDVCYLEQTKVKEEILENNFSIWANNQQSIFY